MGVNIWSFSEVKRVNLPFFDNESVRFISNLIGTFVPALKIREFIFGFFQFSLLSFEPIFGDSAIFRRDFSEG